MHPSHPSTPAGPRARRAVPLLLLALAGPALGSQGPTRTLPEDPPGTGRTAVPPRPDGSDLESADLATLEAAALDAAQVLVQRRLQPDPELVRSRRKLLLRANTGVVVLLARGGVPVRSPRGNGAYYSFATGSHSYNLQPDLGLQADGRLVTGFYGGQNGALLDLGELDLARIEGDPATPPEDAEGLDAEHWRLLCGPFDDRGDPAEEGPDRLRAANLGSAAAIEGHAYLLRMHSPQEHDILVAFEVLRVEPDRCTLAWRQLERFPMADARPVGEPREGGPRDVDPRLEDLSDEDLTRRAEHARARATELLLAVGTDVRTAFLRRLGSQGRAPRIATVEPEVRVGRILLRGRYEGLVPLRGDGAYLGLRDGSNTYDDDPELEYQQGSFHSGFAGGDEGLFLDLGELDDGSLASLFLGELPEGLVLGMRERATFLREVRTAPRQHLRERFTVDSATRSRLGTLGLSDRVPARVGHTYLLRTLFYDSHDVLAVFTVLEDRDEGLTLAWRVLETIDRPLSEPTGPPSTPGGRDR